MLDVVAIVELREVHMENFYRKTGFSFKSQN